MRSAHDELEAAMTPSKEPDVLSTTAGDLALEEYHLRLGAHAWRILHTGAVLGAEDERRFLTGGTEVPYGIVLWPAAIALAHDLGARPVEGLRVLELGAGTGLPGIVAATRGAHVVQTDRQPVALYVCKKNAERNGVTSIEHRDADWRTWTDDARYDLILGSDVLYAASMHEHLRQIFEKNLAEGGMVLLSDPFRRSSFPLFEAMAEAGWRVSVSKWTVGFDSPDRTVGVFELTRGR